MVQGPEERPCVIVPEWEKANKGASSNSSCPAGWNEARSTSITAPRPEVGTPAIVVLDPNSSCSAGTDDRSPDLATCADFEPVPTVEQLRKEKHLMSSVVDCWTTSRPSESPA